MHERQPEPTELDATIEDQIDRIMNTRGLSRAAAEQIVLPQQRESTSLTREESMRQYPTAYVPERKHAHYEPRYDGDTFPVIDNSGISAKQQAINSTAIAAIREAGRVPYEQRTPQQHAMYRAEDERRNKNHN